jgi:lipoprotein NlpI
MPEAWNSLGRFRLLAGDEAGALAAWSRALELDGGHFKARYNRGILHAATGRPAAAAEDLEHARRVAPDSASADRVRRALSALGQASP